MLADLVPAYTIGLSVFGLLLALTLVLSGLLHLVNQIALAGLLVGITVSALAGLRTARALKRHFQ